MKFATQISPLLNFNYLDKTLTNKPVFWGLEVEHLVTNKMTKKVTMTFCRTAAFLFA